MRHYFHFQCGKPSFRKWEQLSIDETFVSKTVWNKIQGTMKRDERVITMIEKAIIWIEMIRVTE